MSNWRVLLISTKKTIAINTTVIIVENMVTWIPNVERKSLKLKTFQNQVNMPNQNSCNRKGPINRLWNMRTRIESNIDPVR